MTGVRTILGASRLTGSEHVDREGLEIALQATAVVEAIESLLKATAELKLALVTSNVARNVAEAKENERKCEALGRSFRAKQRRLRVRFITSKAVGI